STNCRRGCRDGEWPGLRAASAAPFLRGSSATRGRQRVRQREDRGSGKGRSWCFGVVSGLTFATPIRSLSKLGSGRGLVIVSFLVSRTQTDFILRSLPFIDVALVSDCMQIGRWFWLLALIGVLSGISCNSSLGNLPEESPRSGDGNCVNTCLDISYP